MLEDFKLRVFMEVYRTGSFTKSAVALGVSQPAVSQNINALEKALGAKLFVRQRGLATPTAQGLALKDYAEKIIYWCSGAEAMLGASGGLSAGRPIKISADAPLADYLLPLALVKVHAGHPKLSFELTPAGWASNGSTDVDLTVSPIPESLDFNKEQYVVGVMDAAVAVSPLNLSLAKAAGASKAFSTIAGIHVSTHFAIWEQYAQFLGPDVMARTCFQSSSIESVKTLVRNSSDLAAIVPTVALREELENETLVRLPVPLSELSFDVHFLPRPSFAARSTCSLLRLALENELKL